MPRVTSGLVLNKAGSKNVNYCLMFCFAAYSHQEKWNISESPEYKWERVCSIVLSYFGYALKRNVNHSQTAHQRFSDSSSCVTWHQCHLWTCYEVHNFPGNWENRKSWAEYHSICWGKPLVVPICYNFCLNLERNTTAKHFLASIAFKLFYVPSSFSLRICVRQLRESMRGKKFPRFQKPYKLQQSCNSSSYYDIAILFQNRTPSSSSSGLLALWFHYFKFPLQQRAGQPLL